MESVIFSGFAFIGAFLIAILILIIIMYVFMGVFLGKLNKLIYGKGTPMAWIPLLNTYLMGKLVVNKVFGIILVIIPFIISFIPGADISNTHTTVQNGVQTTVSTSTSLNTILLLVYSLICLVIFVLAVVKYFKLKKNRVTPMETETPNVTMPTPPIGSPAPVTEQPVVPGQTPNVAESFDVPESLTQPVENNQISAEPIPESQINNNVAVQGVPQTPGIEKVSPEPNVPQNVFQTAQTAQTQEVITEEPTPMVVNTQVTPEETPVTSETVPNNTNSIFDTPVETPVSTPVASVATPVETPVNTPVTPVATPSVSPTPVAQPNTQPSEPYDIFSSMPTSTPTDPQN